MAAQKKQHWFLMAFAIPAQGHTAFTSVFMAHKTKDMTLPVIQSVRSGKGIPDQACTISVSYLGYMTQDQMNPPPETIPNLIAPTEPYMDGYHAASEMHVQGNSAPSNPFLSTVPGEPMSQDAIDWAEGFMACCKRVGAVGKTSADL